jgi:hypothetical protein
MLPYVFCKEMHWATNCSMELKHKKAVIVKEKRCSNCFGLHETIHCFNPHRCQICKAKHHTALSAEKETRFGASTVIPNTTVTTGCCSLTTALASSSMQSYSRPQLSTLSALTEEKSEVFCSLTEGVKEHRSKKVSQSNLN